jgi:hypothetical protein
MGVEHETRHIPDSTSRVPQHPEHEEILEWVGGEFEPAAFDRDEVDKELQRLK